MNKVERYKEFEYNFGKWEKLQPHAHILSPTDPKKTVMRLYAQRWKTLLNEDVELYDQYEEVKLFKRLFR